MDALGFIEKDLKRSGRAGSPFVFGGIWGAALVPAALGLGLRPSLGGVGGPHVLIPNVLAALLLALAAWLTRQRTPRAFQAVRAALVVAALLAIERAIFPPGGARTTFASPEEFRTATTACFAKGALATIVTGAWLGILAFAFSPWPSRRWRAIVAFGAGVSGAVMLGFHCDSSDWNHVLLGHLGQGVAMGAGLFIIFEGVFQLGLKSRLPELMAKVRNPRRIG